MPFNKNRAIIYSILAVLLFIICLTGCTLQDDAIHIELPNGSGQFFENMEQNWPNIIQGVVDDVWSQDSTTVTNPDFVTPDYNEYIPETTPRPSTSNTESTPTPIPENTPPTANTDDYSPMYVHFLDVGQADCVLFLLDDKVMLIDAGNNADDKMIVEYLDDLGINTIDYFILTHPHEDHIGGADTVINSFEIKNLLMSNKEATTKTYKDVVTAINNHALVPHYVTPGEKFYFGDAELLIVGPYNTDSNEPNNSSVAVKITYGNDTMLFAGDTEAEYEKLIVNSGWDLESDLFKANHHGSGGANSYVWLKEVNPKYVVIQCETGNSYGHPHKDALSRFNDVGAIIYRNDTMGTIIATSTGNGIYFNKEGIEPTREHTSKGR